jgi:hypothetical protein
MPQIRAILDSCQFNFLFVLLFWRKSAIRLFARKHEATTVKIFVDRSFYSLVIVTGLMAIFVAGCGGGEGANTINLTLPSISDPGPAPTSAPAPAPTSYTIAIPERLQGRPADGVLNAPFDLVAPFGVLSLSVASTPNYSNVTYVEPMGLSVNFPSYSHIFDSGAKTAWQQGWNGSGSTISVIDDFVFKQTSLNVPFSYTATFRISFPSALFQAQYKKNMSLVFSMSHGDLVSGLAGGKPSDWQHTGVPMQGFVLTSCSSTQIIDCPPTYPASDRFTQGLAQAQGVAKNALVTNNHVGLGDNFDPIRYFTLLQGHLSNSASSTAINLSIGQPVQIGNLSIESLLNETQNAHIASTVRDC